jgi:hypothetical protein
LFGFVCITKHSVSIPQHPTKIFIIAAKDNSLQGYYDESNNPATPELVSSMPSNAQLVFWDYYHASSDIYLQKLQQHRDMGCQDPWIASKYL